MGKRKNNIERIEEESRRQVTFSRRRKGLFKKAHELSVLCGCDIAIVTFSAEGKPYTFGSPDPDIVIDRYCSAIADPLLHHQITKQERQLNIEKSNAVDDLEQSKCALMSLRNSVLTRLGEASSSSSSYRYGLGSSSDGLASSYGHGFDSLSFDAMAAQGGGGAVGLHGFLDSCLFDADSPNLVTSVKEDHQREAPPLPVDDTDLDYLRFLDETSPPSFDDLFF